MQESIFDLSIEFWKVKEFKRHWQGMRIRHGSLTKLELNTDEYNCCISMDIW